MLKLNGTIVTGDTFPNNETTLNVKGKMLNHRGGVQTIHMYFEDDKDPFHLLLLVSHLRDILGPNSEIELICPYLPYSRSDRPMLSRAGSLKAICDLINGMHFNRVVICEPHSDVSVMLLKNVEVVNTSLRLGLQAAIDRLEFDCCYQCVLQKMKEEGYYFVFPDNGAEKRYVQQLNEIDPTFANYKVCSKRRDIATGKITSFVVADVNPDEPVKHAIIVDDLCSKGGTFILCADAIRQAYPVETVDLCVTHCEQNIYNGSIPTSELIDKVYIGNTMLTKPKGKITQVNVI